MSRRARRRARESGQYRRRATPAAQTARATLDSTRRALATQLGFAALLAMVSLVGTAGLGGTLAPLIVLAVVLVGSLVVYARTRASLDGVVLAGEDRTLYAMGTLLLVLACVFAFIVAVVLAVV